MNIRQQKIALVFLLILTNVLAYFYFFMVPLRGTGIVASGGEATGPFKFYFSIYGPGSGNEPEFLRPYDVALDDLGNIFVTDIDAHRVVVFNRFGRYLFQFGGGGMAKPPGGVKATWQPGFFLYPAGIDIDIAGNVYVVDSGNRRINVYDTKGNFKNYLPEDKSPVTLNMPLMVKATGKEVYVTDRGRVVVFSKDGKFLRNIGKSGREQGELSGPDGITVDDDGNVYVADGLNMTLQAYDKEGNLKWVVGKPPTSIREGDRRFGLPCGLAITSENAVLVADAFHHTIHAFNIEDGERLAEVGGLGPDNGLFRFPRGLTIGPNDVIYIADSINKRVQALRLLKYETIEEYDY